MAIVTLSSLGHSPGTTATAVAMALRWPRPCLLIEADTSRTSSILAGRLRGQVPHRVGLTNLASAATHDELRPDVVWANAVALAPERGLVPGFSTLGAARGADAFWWRLAELLLAFEHAAADVILDLGRCDASDARMPLVRRADLALVATGATLPDIAATTAPVRGSKTRLHELGDALDEVGHREALQLVVIERARENYALGEIRRACGVPVLGALPYAPDDAAAFALGTDLGRREARCPLGRAVDALVTAGLDRVAAARARLGTPESRRESTPAPAAAHAHRDPYASASVGGGVR